MQWFKQKKKKKKVWKVRSNPVFPPYFINDTSLLYLDHSKHIFTPKAAVAIFSLPQLEKERENKML